MDSKRLATLKALTAYLNEEITEANGYEHTLADGAVTRGRMFYTADDPLPNLSILDNVNPDRFPSIAGKQDGEAGEAKTRWIVLVQGWVEDDKRNPTDPAEQLMADVKKALSKLDHDPNPMSNDPMSEHHLLGGLITGLEIEPGVVRPPDENSSQAYFWLRVILHFVENVRDPFDHR